MKEYKDSNGVVLAIVISNDYIPIKTEFYTPNEYSQQLGIIKYQQSHKIKPHYHNPVERQVLLTQEVLIIRKGCVKVYLYDNKMDFVTDFVLTVGDVILLASGGHGFEMIEDAEMIEVKQGPYIDVTKDKTHFEF